MDNKGTQTSAFLIGVDGMLCFFLTLGKLWDKIMVICVLDTNNSSSVGFVWLKLLQGLFGMETSL